jgi:hypothetical protein
MNSSRGVHPRAPPRSNAPMKAKKPALQLGLVGDLNETIDQTGRALSAQPATLTKAHEIAHRVPHLLLHASVDVVALIVLDCAARVHRDFALIRNIRTHVESPGHDDNAKWQLHRDFRDHAERARKQLHLDITPRTLQDHLDIIAAALGLRPETRRAAEETIRLVQPKLPKTTMRHLAAAAVYRATITEGERGHTVRDVEYALGEFDVTVNFITNLKVRKQIDAALEVPTIKGQRPTSEAVLSRDENAGIIRCPKCRSDNVQTKALTRRCENCAARWTLRTGVIGYDLQPPSD